MKKLTLEEFTQKAFLIHNNKYNYKDVLITGIHNKIIIKCREHGTFLQTPNNHLKGQGCPYCAGVDKSNIVKFTQKALVTHGNKYDYSKSVYTNARTKICIICYEHGEFWQSPNKHLSGRGCPNCQASKGELTIKTILDKYKIHYELQFNIPEIINNYKIDFYLPKYRLLIEFHGIQHYKYIPFFHDGDYTFEDQKTRDGLVRDAAIRWKYNYLEFNYLQLKHMTQEQFEQMVINKIK